MERNTHTWTRKNCQAISVENAHLHCKCELNKDEKLGMQLFSAGVLVRPNPLNFTALYRIDSFYKIQQNPICALFALNILLFWAAMMVYAYRLNLSDGFFDKFFLKIFLKNFLKKFIKNLRKKRPILRTRSPNRYAPRCRIFFSNYFLYRR